jgi:hypothetical protein
MVAQFLGKGSGSAGQTCQSATHPAVAPLKALGVVLANQMLKIRQQGGKLFPAVSGVKVNLDAFQPFEQIADSGLVSLTHRNSEYLLGFGAVSVQNPDLSLFRADKRPHFINLNLEIPFLPGLNPECFAPTENQTQHRPGTDQQHRADITDTTATQQHPLDQYAYFGVAGIVEILVLELLAALLAPIVLLAVALFAIPDYLCRLAVRASDLSLYFAHKAQNYAFAAFFLEHHTFGNTTEFTSPKVKINATSCAYTSKTTDKPKPVAFIRMLYKTIRENL